LQSVSAEVSKAVQDFLDAIASDLTERRAASRRAVDKAIILTKAGENYEARASDVSQTGMKISSSRTLRVGDIVRVDLEFEHVDAKVIWSNSNNYGLEFINPSGNEVVNDPHWANEAPGKIAA
jgi:hypothetical protein